MSLDKAARTLLVGAIHERPRPQRCRGITVGSLLEAAVSGYARVLTKRVNGLRRL